MEGVDYKYGYRRINNQIGYEQSCRRVCKHTGLDAGHAVAKQHGHIVKEVLCMPTDVKPYPDTKRIPYEQKSVSRETSKRLFRWFVFSNNRVLDWFWYVSVVR